MGDGHAKSIVHTRHSTESFAISARFADEVTAASRNSCRTKMLSAFPSRNVTYGSGR